MSEHPDRRYTQAELDEIIRNRLEEQAERIWATRVDTRLDSIEDRLDVRQRLLKVWGWVVAIVTPIATAVLERLTR